MFNKNTTLLILKHFAKYWSEFSCVDYRFTLLLPLFTQLTKTKKTNEQNKDILNSLSASGSLCTSQVEASTSPPGNSPGHLNFWKIFVEIPPPRAKKLFKCLTIGPFQVIKWPHPRYVQVCTQMRKLRILRKIAKIAEH